MIGCYVIKCDIVFGYFLILLLCHSLVSSCEALIALLFHFCCVDRLLFAAFKSADIILFLREIDDSLNGLFENNQETIPVYFITQSYLTVKTRLLVP